MSEINTPILISGSLPDAYQEVHHWSITEKPARAIAAQILGVFSFIIFGLTFFRLAISLGRLPSHVESGLGEIGLAFVGLC